MLVCGLWVWIGLLGFMGQISLLGFMGQIGVWFVASYGLWVVTCDVLVVACDGCCG